MVTYKQTHPFIFDIVAEHNISTGRLNTGKRSCSAVPAAGVARANTSFDIRHGGKAQHQHRKTEHGGKVLLCCACCWCRSCCSGAVVRLKLCVCPLWDCCRHLSLLCVFLYLVCEAVILSAMHSYDRQQTHECISYVQPTYCFFLKLDNGRKQDSTT